MRINQLRHQIDRDHAYREENPHCVGIPLTRRMPKLRFTIKYARDGEQSQERNNTMAKSVEGKNKAAAAATEKKAAKPAKPEMWGSKEMAAALKIEPKRLRTILRAVGKGVSGDGEVGRYEWKPNDAAAIKSLGKIVAEYEAKVAAKAEAKEKPAKKAAAPAAKKAKAKKAPEPVEEVEEETEEEGDVFEEEGEEVEA